MDKKQAIKKGSETAKSGFKNERAVAEIFNSWKSDIAAKYWLEKMGYNLFEIKNVEAYVFNTGNGSGKKTDVIVKVDGKENGISIKLFKADFNQIQRGWIDKYAEMWNMPEFVKIALKRYTGEEGNQPSNYMTKEQLKQLRENRAKTMTTTQQKTLEKHKNVLLSELPKDEQDKIYEWFSKNKKMIVSDILKGKDNEIPPKWLLVVKHSGGKVIKTGIVHMDKAIEHYSKGDIVFTNRTTIQIGGISAQRKSGDGGRPSGQQLQFKFHPNEVFDII